VIVEHGVALGKEIGKPKKDTGPRSMREIHIVDGIQVSREGESTRYGMRVISQQAKFLQADFFEARQNWNK